MAITFRCEYCGKKIEAPDSAGGKRGKCPYCKQSNYIPSAVREDEILELAGEDEPVGRGRKAADESSRRLDRELAAELGRGEPADVPLDQKEDLKPQDVEHLIVNYCLDLASSRLDRAELHLEQMKKFRATARQAVEDFASGKVVEPALKQIPARVLQGFLAQLRKALAS